MENKPSIEDILREVPEASNFEELGCGGYKVAYKAQIGARVEAVKLACIPSDEKDPSVREENMRRIRREIDVLGKCSTAYLVKLGSIAPRDCTIGSNEYLVYSEEYIPGPPLRKLILDDYRPTVAELAEVGICLLQAVQELAAMNVIHRDIKPDNIIKSSDPDRPYVLLDLGIAFHVGGTPLTRDTNRVPGTLYYIAPEMLDVGFRQNLDYRADLYTIGLSLYEFASGDNPFAHRSDPQFTTLYRIKIQTPNALHHLRSDLPIDFCALVDQLMKKLPALRPSNIAALRKRLEGFR